MSLEPRPRCPEHLEDDHQLEEFECGASQHHQGGIMKRWIYHRRILQTRRAGYEALRRPAKYSRTSSAVIGSKAQAVTGEVSESGSTRPGSEYMA